MAQKSAMKKYRKISTPVKASVVYTLASLFTKGISIITMPIFTRIMSTSEIGVVTTFASWQTIISVLATLSLGTGAFNIAMLDFKNDRDNYESSILLLSTISSVLFLSVYLIFGDYIDIFFGLDHNLMIIMLLGFVFSPAMDYWMARQRYEYKYKNTIIVTLSLTIITTFVSIITVLVGKKIGYDSLGSVRIISTCLITILFSVVFYGIIIKRGKFSYNKQYWSFALKLNLPLTVHALAKHVLDVSDRTMISGMLGKSAVGIYGTLYSIGNLSSIIWSAINASLVPYMFEKMKRHEEKDIGKTINNLLFVYAIFAIILTLIAPEIVKILATEEYYSAIYMMPPVAAGIYLTSLYNIFGNVLLYNKKTMNIMAATICAAIINIALNYILIPKFGFIAASYTTLVANVFLSVFQFLFMLRVQKERIFQYKQMIVISGFTVLIILLCNILYQSTIIRYIVLSLILFLAMLMRKKIILVTKKIRNK